MSFRTHNCGGISDKNLNQEVTLSGWADRIRNKGFILWIDLRDRYGIIQLVFDAKRTSEDIFKCSKNIQREYVIQAKGTVVERESKNLTIKNGNIEILVNTLKILNTSKTPPFTIEEKTDGGDELRMRYRYLDLRRPSLKENLIFRHKVANEIRQFLSNEEFIEIETPFLIKTTPEGAQDFVVPSRIHKGTFYALPQSPQTFKQLLMIGGIDKYFQIVKCFRDEDFRSDRQPEFTQIDCEMSFVNQEDILQNFEKLIIHLLQKLKGIEIKTFPRITYEEAMNKYGSDKPDIRFGMELEDITPLAQGKNFSAFDTQEFVGGIAIPKGSQYSRKQIDEFIEWVKRPQVGAKGIIWVKYNVDKKIQSSVSKFFTDKELLQWIKKLNASPGDLLFIMSGETKKTKIQLGLLRIEIAERLGLRNNKTFAPLWVTDFPLLEWDAEAKRFSAMHHPFTAPKKEDISLLEKSPSQVRANAYDLVLNGNEIGGGSIRIHQADLQNTIFNLLGISKKEAKKQFGFLMEAFQYGAPPHGGIAFGFDRLVALLSGKETIRDFIAFPKNNSGKDTMINAPSTLEEEQLKTLSLKIFP